MDDLVEPEAESVAEKESLNSSDASDSFELEDEFEGMPVPQSFVLFTLLSYTAFGALLFSQWEGWNFVDSFYFCLITMTTVGFGVRAVSNSRFAGTICSSSQYQLIRCLSILYNVRTYRTCKSEELTLSLIHIAFHL